MAQGLRRGGHRARASISSAGSRIVPALRSFGRTAILRTRRGIRAVRRNAIAVWRRSLALAGSVAQTTAVRLRRGVRVVRRGARAASVKSKSALQSVARTTLTGLGRGGRTVREGAGIAWDRTVLTASWLARLARTVTAASRRGAQQGRQRATAIAGLAVAAVHSGAAVVAAGVHGGVRFLGEDVGAGRRAVPAPDGVAFEVVGGVHGGVRLVLESGEYGIGSTPEADIVLRDPGVMSGHAVLMVQRGRIRLAATGGDVGVGTQTILQGHGCRLRLPFELSLGGASMRVSRIETEATGRSRLAIAGLAAVSAVAVVVVTIGLLREEVKAGPGRAATTVPSSESRAELASPGREDGPTDTVSASAHPVPLIAEAMHELTDRINAVNIRTLRVSVVEGRLAVSGALAPQDTPAWSAIQQWFDQTYRGRLVLTTNPGLGEARAMPTLQLRAVWFGERPYVITAEGAHFNQGAILDNGWVIQDIGEDRIVLSKKAETVTLAYR
jgi:type III secretion system (T3SS) inner membrane Yop/YscD-like protein/type III secretion system (T3SS) inner membrane Yop/CscD-like protein